MTKIELIIRIVAILLFFYAGYMFGIRSNDDKFEIKTHETEFGFFQYEIYKNNELILEFHKLNCDSATIETLKNIAEFQYN